MSGTVQHLRQLEGRVPPHDTDAEGAVLSAALLSPEAFDTVQDILEPEHFYADANRRIFEVLVELRVEGQPADGVTVASRLKNKGRLDQVGGTSYLARLTNQTPAVAHVEAHAGIVHDKWRVRRIIANCQKYAAEGYGEIQDVQAFADKVEHALFEITSNAAEDTNASMRTIIEESLREIDEAALSKNGVVGVATGFLRWDRMTTGMRDGELHVLAARPGMGKTALAVDAALNVAKTGDGVQIFSPEMRRHLLGMRMISSEARIDLQNIRRGALTEDEMRHLKATAPDLAGLPLHVDDGSAPTLLKIRATVRRKDSELRREGKKLRLLVVDYVQLMEGEHIDQGREREVSALSRGLKKIATDFGVPVLALSQLNRGVESRSDKRPLLSDLRESGAIEQDADVVTFIFRDEYYTKEDSKAPGVAELIFAKQRNGPVGTIRLGFESEYTHFYDLPETDEAGLF